MKSLSIRMKITLWFSIMLIIVSAVTFGVILYVSNSVLQTTTKNELVEAVEENYNEIEFFEDLSVLYMDNDADQYIEYKGGYLEIDDDFLKSVNGICTALYDEEGSLLYGENPIPSQSSVFDFSATEGIRSITVNNLKYYIYDKAMDGYGLDGLYLRGIVSSEHGNTQLYSIVIMCTIFLPLILIIAILGGYIIAKRSLKPIKDITDTMMHINESNDLKKRLEIKDGDIELNRLSETFNEMLQSLDGAFEREKRFVSDVSHELRTPVSVILAECEYALEENCEKEYKDALDIISRQGKKMDTIISQMLEFSRLEFHSEVFTKENFNLSQLAEQVCTDMSRINKSNITLNSSITPDIQYFGNRQLISRLIINLVTNAYKYGIANGYVNVELHKDNDGIYLNVSDNGIGISPENLDKIFERFYQTDLSRHNEGNGLGLSLVKEIAKFHNSTVTVKSEIGKGSTFTVIFK